MAQKIIGHPDVTANREIKNTTIKLIDTVGRHRKDFGDIAALARSIEKLGLLQPIGVNGSYKLLWGMRRLRAYEFLGIEKIPARIVNIDDLLTVEHDENEMRKAFTVEERVAIGKAIESELQGRQGQRSDLVGSPLVQNFAQVEGKKTRDIAAEKAGFKNAETYRQAKKVVDDGTEELRDSVNKGEIAVSTAAVLADMPAEEQFEVTSIQDVKEKKRAAIEAVKEAKLKKALSNDTADVRAGLDAETMYFLRRTFKVLSDANKLLNGKDPIECGEWMASAFQAHHHNDIHPSLRNVFLFINAMHQSEYSKVIKLTEAKNA